MTSIFFTGILPFVSVLTGALISGVTAYNSKRLVDQKNAKRQLAIKLYEEYHSKEMYESRLETARVLMDNPEGNLEDLYQNLPEESFMHLSQLFHWIEKAGLFEKNNQIDASLRYCQVNSQLKQIMPYFGNETKKYIFWPPISKRNYKSCGLALSPIHLKLS